MDLTIIIPCKNERMTIIRTLSALDACEALRGVRVIVADSSTDVMTPFMVDRMEWKRIHVERIAGGYPAAARNNGARLATTTYLLFLDADMEITTVPILDDRYDLTTCVTATADQYAWIYSMFRIGQWILAHHTPFALGGYMLFKRDIFWKLGGFVEADKVAEDFHLSMKVSPKKFRIYKHRCYTTGRRLQQKGIWYMIQLMYACWKHRHTPEFFTHDHGYWT
jgi:glycosyltransferase involved in cell wall biosynthesis